MMQKCIAFIGLGTMGFPMAGHLSLAGYDVVVYNRTPAKAQKWLQQYKGRLASTPKQATEQADIVLFCVGNDADVREIVLGEHGLLAGAHAGQIFVDHTTASDVVEQDMAQACAQKQVHYCDAPVSGGQSGAEQGRLTIMVGGDEHCMETLQPVFACYSQKAVWMGPVGYGQRCKMVNQICIAGVLQGLSEGLILAEKSQLPIDKLLETITLGAAGSWQMSNRGHTMHQRQFDFGFASDLMIKDLGLCLDYATGQGLQLPMTTATRADYQSLSQKGFGKEDTSALVRKFDF